MDEPASAAASDPTQTARIPPRAAQVAKLAWVFLSIASTLPFLVAEFPPLYDFYHWMFQGYIVKALALGGPSAAEPASSIYRFAGTPVPDTVTPVGIALLSVWMPLGLAGRVFLALCVLAFAYGFAYLVRSVQQRPTVVEYLGFVWAFGYFMYKGYDSYLFSLAVAFVAIGKLHQSTLRNGSSSGGRDLAALTGLSTVLYLCHLGGWLVFATAVVAYGLWLMRNARLKNGLQLFVTLVPAAMLLIWYVTAEGSNRGHHFYNAASDKALSLVEPMLFFLRTDPFHPVLPLFWLNLVALALLALIIVWNVEGLHIRTNLQPLSLAAIFLVAVALIMPFSEIGGLIRPDERLIFPGLLIATTIFRLKTFTASRGALAGLFVLLIIGEHVWEYGQASQSIVEVKAAIAAAVPPHTPRLSITLHAGELYGGCEAQPGGFTVGTPTLKWLGLYDSLENGNLRANIMETSLVRTKADAVGSPGLTVLFMDPKDMRTQSAIGQRYAATYPFVEVFGCQKDFGVARKALAPQYAEVTEGVNFLVLRRK